jgi:hypothetical protein
VRPRISRPEAGPAVVDRVDALDRDLARLAVQLRIVRGRGEQSVAAAYLAGAIDACLDERRRLTAQAQAAHRA